VSLVFDGDVNVMSAEQKAQFTYTAVGELVDRFNNVTRDDVKSATIVAGSILLVVDFYPGAVSVEEAQVVVSNANAGNPIYASTGNSTHSTSITFIDKYTEAPTAAPTSAPTLGSWCQELFVGQTCTGSASAAVLEVTQTQGTGYEKLDACMMLCETHNNIACCQFDLLSSVCRAFPVSESAVVTVPSSIPRAASLCIVGPRWRTTTVSPNTTTTTAPAVDEGKVNTQSQSTALMGSVSMQYMVIGLLAAFVLVCALVIYRVSLRAKQKREAEVGKLADDDSDISETASNIIARLSPRPRTPPWAAGEGGGDRESRPGSGVPPPWRTRHVGGGFKGLTLMGGNEVHWDADDDFDDDGIARPAWDRAYHQNSGPEWDSAFEHRHLRRSTADSRLPEAMLMDEELASRTPNLFDQLSSERSVNRPRLVGGDSWRRKSSRPALSPQEQVDFDLALQVARARKQTTDLDAASDDDEDDFATSQDFLEVFAKNRQERAAEQEPEDDLVSIVNPTTPRASRASIKGLVATQPQHVEYYRAREGAGTPEAQPDEINSDFEHLAEIDEFVANGGHRWMRNDTSSEGTGGEFHTAPSIGTIDTVPSSEQQMTVKTVHTNPETGVSHRPVTKTVFTDPEMGQSYRPLSPGDVLSPRSTSPIVSPTAELQYPPAMDTEYLVSPTPEPSPPGGSPVDDSYRPLSVEGDAEPRTLPSAAAPAKTLQRPEIAIEYMVSPSPTSEKPKPPPNFRRGSVASLKQQWERVASPTQDVTTLHRPPSAASQRARSPMSPQPPLETLRERVVNPTSPITSPITSPHEATGFTRANNMSRKLQHSTQDSCEL
jgi:hypothetical protein